MGKRRAKMEVEGGGGAGGEGEDAQAQISTLNGELDDSRAIDQKQQKKKKKKTAKTNVGGCREEVEEKEEPRKEGAFLLGDPTFLDLGNGRLRCVETGHELLARDKEAYGSSKSCRLALIDAAIAGKRPPLNLFEPHAAFKSKLLCKLTGRIVNKSEEHIWKHINGKKFYNKLEQKESEKYANEESVEKDTKQSKKKSKSTKTKVVSSNDQKKGTHENDSSIKKTKADSLDDEELDFWVPPTGSRWDCDDGTDRWDSLMNSGDEADDGNGLDPKTQRDGNGALDHSRSIKRTSKGIGPSSFTPRKKKIKKAHKKHSE